MEDMLGMLNLKLEGRHHSGIDDTRNIARCALKLIKDGKLFNKRDVSYVKTKHRQQNYFQPKESKAKMYKRQAEK